MKYIIDFDVFEAAMLFKADNDVRYYLNGIRLCRNRVEASNGHCGYMAKIDRDLEVPFDGDYTRLLPDVIINTKNKVPSKTKANNFMCCVITLDDTPRIDYLDYYGNAIASDLLEVIDGKFPNLAKLFSDQSKQESIGEEFGLNASYMALVSKVLKREKFPIVRFSPKASDQSVMIKFNRRHLIGITERVIIMPARL